MNTHTIAKSKYSQEYSPVLTQILNEVVQMPHDTVMDYMNCFSQNMTKRTITENSFEIEIIADSWFEAQCHVSTVYALFPNKPGSSELYFKTRSLVPVLPAIYTFSW